MNKSCIISATHYVLPQTVLADEELFERFGEKKIRGISKLSGIKSRRVVSADVTAVDLGAEAAKRLIETEELSRDDFDMLILVTQTSDYRLPSGAFIIHDRLGMPETCGAFDINIGCPAMPYALSVARALVVSGQCKKIMLVFAETITKLINPNDRTLVPLHGDGAAAFVLEASDTDTGIEFCDLGAESSGWKHLIVPAGGMRLPSSAETAKETAAASGAVCSQDDLQMNGAAIFHFSISKIPEEIKKSLAKHSRKISDYKLVLLHQANKMMVEQIYSIIGAADEQKFFFMEDIGNLSVASSPVLLAEALRQGKLAEGGRVLGAAFGVGLSWGVFSIDFAPHSVKASNASTEY